MKQNQKSNQKFNSKLIFLGSLLILISVAFIFASGCVTTDINSDMAEVINQQMANAESQGQTLEVVPVPVPGGVVQPVNEYEDTYNPSSQQPTSKH